MQFVLTHLFSLMLIKMDASSIQTVNLFFPNDKNNARVVLDKEKKTVSQNEDIVLYANSTSEKSHL